MADEVKPTEIPVCSWCRRRHVLSKPSEPPSSFYLTVCRLAGTCPYEDLSKPQGEQ